MLIKRRNPFTRKTVSTDLPITQEQYDAWKNGDLIQDIMPHLSPDEREFLITGLLPEDWNRLWSEEDDELQDGEGLIKTEEQIKSTDDPKPWIPASTKVYSTKRVMFLKFKQIWPIVKYLDDNTYLAGGALRTILTCAAEEVSDFDLFFKSFDKVLDLRDSLLADGYSKVFECPEGKLYTLKNSKHKIQLICETEYSSPQELIESFDMAAGACCLFNNEVFFTREFVRNVFRKRLRIQNVTFPVATIKRLVKYANKGYNINGAAMDFVELIQGKSFDTDQKRVYID